MARHSFKKLLLKQKQKLSTPFDAAAWARVIETYALSDAQAHLLSMILQGESEERMMFELELTHLALYASMDELCERVGVPSRDRLVVKMYAMLWI